MNVGVNMEASMCAAHFLQSVAVCDWQVNDVSVHTAHKIVFPDS